MRIVLVDPSRAVQRAMRQLILITSTQPLSISGVDLCAAARKLSGVRRALHVILMSSTNDYYLAVLALDSGADDFIHKPPNADELRARLRLADRVTSMKQQLIQFATTDPLTGLLNRRAFFDCAAEMYHAAENVRSISAIMFDVDHFKHINDTYGHEMGDRVLAAVGIAAKTMDGAVGRLGGEEFCVLAFGEAADAAECASELQRSIRALRFEHECQEFSITCSFGVAEWEANDAVDGMLRRADLAMYEAKKSGRDRIALSDTYALSSEHDNWRGAARAGQRPGVKFAS